MHTKKSINLRKKIEQKIILIYQPLGYGPSVLPLRHPALIQTYKYEHVQI